MAVLVELIAGSEVQCTDGHVGHVRGLIFDPQGGTITHLSVDTRSAVQKGRIVPIGYVQSGGSTTQLSCPRSEYHRFPVNEDWVAPIGPPKGSTILHVHLVPHGETALDENQAVHAADGRGGHLAGVRIEPGSHAVRELLVRVGHFAGRQASVPFDAVAGIDRDGIHLRLSKRELSADVGLT